MSEPLLPIVGVVKVTSKPDPPRRSVPPPPASPFITISRQAGTNGRSFAAALADGLSARMPGPPWRAYDRELVEQIAAEARLPRVSLETLEDGSHHWLADLFHGLTDGPTDLKVFRQVAATMRRLARQGRAILVGRGGALITHDMPGGLHLQLISPHRDRVRAYAADYHLTVAEAERRVREIDANRAAFYRRYFPGHEPSLETYDLTINLATLGSRPMHELIAPLLRYQPAEAVQR